LSCKSIAEFDALLATIEDVVEFNRVELEKKAFIKAQQERQAELDRIEAERQYKLAQEHQKKIEKYKDEVEFSQDLADEICERVAGGELAINICKDPHMPRLKTLRAWLRNKNLLDFQLQMKEAEQDRLAIFEEEIIAIADDGSNDTYEKEGRNGTITVVDNEVISRSKLRVEMRLKHLRAGHPQKWNDSSTQVVVNNGAVDSSKLSDGELNAEIEAIRKKKAMASGKSNLSVVK